MLEAALFTKQHGLASGQYESLKVEISQCRAVDITVASVDCVIVDYNHTAWSGLRLKNRKRYRFGMVIARIEISQREWTSIR